VLATAYAAHPERFVKVVARLVGSDTARQILEKSLRSGHVKEDVAQTATELLTRPDAELLEYVKGFFVEMHKAKLLIPMLLQSGFLKKNDAPD